MKFSLFGVNLIHWIAAVVLFFIAWVLIQQGPSAKEKNFTLVDVDPACDLRAGPCLSNVEQGVDVSFGIEPRSIPVAETLDLEVNIAGLEVDEITVDINGVNMKMPPNRVKLKRTEPGQFKGQAGLMYCTRDVMEWETVLELDTADGLVKVPYRFITVSDGKS